MQKKRLAQLSILFICFCFLLTACTPSPWNFFPMDSDETEKAASTFERNLVPFSEMKYERPDVPATISQIDAYTSSLQNAGNFTEAWAAYQGAEDVANAYYTMYSLASIRSYQDTTDTFFDEENRFCRENSITVEIAGNRTTSAVLESPYLADFKAELGDYYIDNMKTQLLLVSPEIEEYKKERSLLEADYDTITVDLTVDANGQKYTIDDIYAIEDPDEMLELYLRFHAEHTEEFAKIYARMVELDKITAETLGLSSAADMYYMSYSRDYTPKDALQFAANTKKILVPVASNIYKIPIPYGDADYTETFKAIPGVLAKIDPELKTVWDTMIEYDLYDYEPLPNKKSGIGFTNYLNSYDVPFSYGYWENTTSDTSTVIHEFGHFYDYWLAEDKSTVFNLDIAEVYSQGLQLLTYPHWDKLSTDKQMSQLRLLQDISGTLIYQVLLEEFQIKSYELETIDANSLGLLYAQLLEEYNLTMPELLAENGADNRWFTVPHLFTSPFYTISYGTSASIAMQIWTVSITDWDSAAQIYMDMIHSDQNQPFNELVQNSGLLRPDDPVAMKNIATSLEEAFNGIVYR